MKYFIGCLGLILFSCGISEADVSNEAQIVSSSDTEEHSKENVNIYDDLEDYGAIKTKPELIDIFGSGNLIDGETSLFGGMARINHTVLTNPNNGQVITFLYDLEDSIKIRTIKANMYIWNDDGEITGTQKIATRSGAFIGMTLKELKDWNESDFNFSGFGWDFGGAISSVKGSKLDDCPVKFELSFDLENPVKGFDQLYGDVELNTGDPKVKRAPIFVCSGTYHPE